MGNHTFAQTMLQDDRINPDNFDVSTPPNLIDYFDNPSNRLIYQVRIPSIWKDMYN